MKIDIGSVPHLNALPLIAGLEKKILLAPPIRLAKLLREGKLNAALVPIAELLEHDHSRIRLPLAIVSHGAVRSVYLAHRVPLTQVKTIVFDPESRTSNLLLKLLLKEDLPHSASWMSPTNPDQADAKILIGDRALASENKLLSEDWQLIDLGQWWSNLTGKPFVYAAWGIRRDQKDKSLEQLLLHAAEDGLPRLKSIATNQTILPPDTAYDYLTQNIQYELGEPEWEGLLEFQRRCHRHHLISNILELGR